MLDINTPDTEYSQRSVPDPERTVEDQCVRTHIQRDSNHQPSELLLLAGNDNTKHALSSSSPFHHSRREPEEGQMAKLTERCVQH